MLCYVSNVWCGVSAWYVMLFVSWCGMCAKLCYEMIVCAIMYYVLLCCCIVVCCVMLCHNIIRYGMLCCLMLCCVVLCYVMLCYVTLCCVSLRTETAMNTHDSTTSKNMHDSSGTTCLSMGTGSARYWKRCNSMLCYVNVMLCSQWYVMLDLCYVI